MNKEGPIIIIEDDADDQFLFKTVFKRLNYANELIFFSDGFKALAYLTDSDVIPFLILSDINMPMLNGFELRSKIKSDPRLHHRCIPFLFFSTAIHQESVTEAYNLSVQGFFLKPVSLKAFEEIVSAIMTYWQVCTTPNSF